ncbi:3-oxo-5-alpha-steroid 4-dehydrogenase-domain-containing protein [Sporodiniella umbellata]|nr:3-oxo-5-alpha-steroid 4-dehydrogenase-domain-containing protein [Sporodiniella umbellata]
MYLILLLCFCLLVLTMLSLCASLFHELQASVLHYGKLNLGSVKKPKTLWASYLSTLTVPKHYFSHFYIVGFLFGLVCSFELYVKKGIVVHALQYIDLPTGSRHLSLLQCKIGLLLMNVHLARRIYESFKIEIPSKEATMHASHYLVGIGFYGAMVFDKGKFSWTTLIAILIYLYASVHQYHCHCILASLRHKSDSKYQVPKGDWFEWIASPHYFADILIYLSLCILYDFKNNILLCGLIWSITNLSITANQTHLWYIRQFPSHPELKNRWRIIPGIY